MSSQPVPSRNTASEGTRPTRRRVGSGSRRVAEREVVTDADWERTLRAAIHPKGIRQSEQDAESAQESSKPAPLRLQELLDTISEELSAAQDRLGAKAHVHTQHPPKMSVVVGEASGEEFHSPEWPLVEFETAPSPYFKQLAKWFEQELDDGDHTPDLFHIVGPEWSLRESPEIQPFPSIPHWHMPTFSAIYEAHSTLDHPIWSPGLSSPLLKKYLWTAEFESTVTRYRGAHIFSDIVDPADQGFDQFDLLDYVEQQVRLAEMRGNSVYDTLDIIRDELQMQSRLREEAMDAIWQREMYSESEAIVMFGTKNVKLPVVEEYRDRSWLVALPSQDGIRYPKFQFRPDRTDVYEVVRTVNTLLDAKNNPWGAVSWWLFPNDRLGDCPANLVAETQDDLSTDAFIAKQDNDRSRSISKSLIAAAKAITGPVG